MGLKKAEALAAEERAGMIQGQKYVRGLYTGGTICDEAMKLLIGSMGHIYSNIPLKAKINWKTQEMESHGKILSWISEMMSLLLAVRIR